METVITRENCLEHCSKLALFLSEMNICVFDDESVSNMREFALAALKPLLGRTFDLFGDKFRVESFDVSKIPELMYAMSRYSTSLKLKIGVNFTKHEDDLFEIMFNTNDFLSPFDLEITRGNCVDVSCKSPFCEIEIESFLKRKIGWLFKERRRRLYAVA